VCGAGTLARERKNRIIFVRRTASVEAYAKDAAKDTGMKKDNTEHGHLKITAVQMVSESCQQ
jgi:hypothetical protein